MADSLPTRSSFTWLLGFACLANRHGRRGTGALRVPTYGTDAAVRAPAALHTSRAASFSKQQRGGRRLSLPRRPTAPLTPIEDKWEIGRREMFPGLLPK